MFGTVEGHDEIQAVFMQRLTGLDSLFLSAESRTNLFHVGAVAILDPSTAHRGTPPFDEAIRGVLEDRIHTLPQLRRRPVPALWGLAHPTWREEGAPNLDGHLSSSTLPSPGGPGELGACVARQMSQALPRDRPMWALHVTDGLEDGKVAAIARIHHSVADGLTGSELTARLADLTPQVQRVPPTESGEAQRRLPGAQAVDDLVHLGGQLPRAASFAMRAANGLRRVRANAESAVAPPLPFSAPPCSISIPLSQERAAACAVLDRGQIDEVRRAADTTVNEVLLALVASGLREHLVRNDELCDRPLVGFVPVSVRRDDAGRSEATNQLSGMLVSLATTEPDPMSRLLAIREGSRGAKEQHHLLGPGFLQSMADLTPPLALQMGSRIASAIQFSRRRPPFNVVISSFPGPTVPLYCAGHRLVAYHPFGPIVDGAAVNVTAMSYEDHLDVGVLSCPGALARPDVLAQDMTEALAFLVKGVQARSGRPHRSAREVVVSDRGETRSSTMGRDTIPRQGNETGQQASEDELALGLEGFEDNPACACREAMYGHAVLEAFLPRLESGSRQAS